MKIVRFNSGRIGVVIDDTIRDVTEVAGVVPGEFPPVGPVRLIAEFESRKAAIAEAAAKAEPIAFSDVVLETPVPWPNKLIAYPVNYHDHATEMATKKIADVQGYFLKSNSSLSGAGQAIELPNLPGREVHHECELAIIIGKEGRCIAPEDALDYIFGYSCLLDITVRGREERVFRKSYDTFTPVGPWITTADEVGDPTDLTMKLWVNGNLRQSATTKDLIIKIRDMIAIASSASTLYPGDIIATGTPAGVDKIEHGDVVAIEIEKVGRMEVPVEAGDRGANIVFAKPYIFERAS
ncbi:fumarylacetoacetate hydrolase family protein [Devosia sp. MC521]|uniref:fumarylacetoacetate hydrolase family protein n=1 Tax=Devosia sp. MC521 TaxID=2759954 RepID=UPI0015F88174|nr:fumarylacetoacetate hydrolase family protein [Devosia sp. MC521]MBJ6988428.1 fumarylacetoacetate hydrolase family protein [Devosia sp. MC521]QMW62473.1 fumarylacetoacetate hydrolase family protein [Devosia sp. MC521]